jgi:hypothetical protein
LTAEEILVRLGIDSAGFGGGLNKAERMMEGFSNKISKSIIGAFVMQPIVGALIGALKGAVEVASQFVGREFWNSFYNVPSDIEARFLDSQRRVFKKAKEVYDKGEKEFATANAKRQADEEAIGALEQQIRAQTALNALAKGGAQPEDEHYKQKQIELTKTHILELEEKAGYYDTNKVERAKLLLEIEKLKADVFQKQNESQRNALERASNFTRFLKEQKEQYADLTKEIDKQRHGLARMQNAELEPYMPSLQQLTEKGFFQGRARRILELGSFATEQLQFGNVAGAKRTVDLRNQMYDKLASQGIVPMRDEHVKEKQIEMAENIKSLVEQRATLKVKPSNGK